MGEGRVHSCVVRGRSNGDSTPLLRGAPQTCDSIEDYETYSSIHTSSLQTHVVLLYVFI